MIIRVVTKGVDIPECDVKLKCIGDNGVYSFNCGDEHVSHFSIVTHDNSQSVRIYVSFGEHLSSFPKKAIREITPGPIRCRNKDAATLANQKSV
jgi:hypothetical protein